ncbi:Crp/Fnr family transcriptional regulator [Clostridium oceanicum]|uniref:Crp/Fnr family transcriptional regulator n=1 Tax=Clostridium oceanicum TaxID=1543 RepID=A0ABN1JEA7_9CLOT
MYNKWIDLLVKVPLFKTIEKEELSKILMCLRPKKITYKKKDLVAISGEKFTGIGIIVEGEVIITKETPSGNRVMMQKFKKGDLFGEMIAFSSKDKWINTVVADKEATILFLEPYKIIGNCPKMCIGHKILIQNMLKIISKKALMLNKKIDYLSIKSIKGKISAYLLEQSKIFNRDTFTISLKRSELAEFLSVSRPSLSRELINMKEDKLIDFYKASFKILDKNSLKNIYDES